VRQPHVCEEEDLPQLYEEAERVAAEQRVHADELFLAKDPKRWFARVYQYVTEEQIRCCRQGIVTHVGWTLRVIPVFHRYYYDENYLPWVEGRQKDVGAHWIEAFEAMEGKRGKSDDPRAPLFLGLKLAIVAHIQEDLPQALAKVYLRHYANRCSYQRYRADYILMADVFHKASARMMNNIPRHYIPWYFRLTDLLLPQEAKQLMQDRMFYDIPRERMKTFEQGRWLAETAGPGRHMTGQGLDIASSAQRCPAR
jgi:hypothetical protein